MKVIIHHHCNVHDKIQRIWSQSTHWRYAN